MNRLCVLETSSQWKKWDESKASPSTPASGWFSPPSLNLWIYFSATNTSSIINLAIPKLIHQVLPQPGQGPNFDPQGPLALGEAAQFVALAVPEELGSEIFESIRRLTPKRSKKTTWTCVNWENTT